MKKTYLKKLIGVTLVTVMGLSAMTACGGSENSNTDTAGTTANEGGEEEAAASKGGEITIGVTSFRADPC